MGQNQSSVSQAEVETNISNIIDISNKQITNIINSTVTDLTTNILQENSAKITQTIAAGNMMNLGDINITGGNNTFCQDSKVNADISAAIQLTQDAAAVSDLANKVNQTVLNKLAANAELSANTQNAFALTQASGNAGGMTGLATAVLGPLNNALKAGSVTTDIKNTKNVTNILNACKINTEQTTNLGNAITNTIKTAITQQNMATCNPAISATNTLNAGKVNIAGGTNNFCQTNNVQAVMSCMIGQVQKAAASNKLATDNTVAATADAAISEKMSTKTDNKVAVTQVSTVGDTPMNSLIIGIVCICCCLCVLALMYGLLQMIK